MDSTELTRIWEKATWGAGFLGDAIKDAKKGKPIRDHLAQAEALIGKAHLEIKQHLANRNTK